MSTYKRVMNYHTKAVAKAQETTLDMDWLNMCRVHKQLSLLSPEL